jgi:tight adherence protein B
MTILILLLSLLLFGVSVFALTSPAYAAGSVRIRRIEDNLQNILSELFIFDLTPRRITYLVLALTALLVLILGFFLGSIIGVIFGLICGLVLPYLLIRRMVTRRRVKLEAKLMDGLITLANGMRAGLNLAQAIKLIEDHSPPPLSQEFGLVMREVEHGTAVDVALERAGHRIKSHNFRLLFAALKTTRKRGGNIPETLDRLGESLREIIRLEEKVKALTAQGRTTAIFMAFMPLVVMGIYWLIDPEGIRLLFTNPKGQAVLGLVALLDFLGFMWIRKIVSFEI